MNRLAGEASPYLRQHADNPVEWYPWEEAAFRVARESDRPILLSIGYSACHWCHVMAHESFEDPATAGVMNRGFVCVKVDREERPDVDAIYMEAVQAVSGRGGWPMTVICLPDGRPFFAGTYFPREQFVALLREVERRWHNSRHQLERDADQVAEAVRVGVSLPTQTWAAGGDPALAGSADLLERAAADLVARLDRVWGGFGQAPKFPQAALVEVLLRSWWGAGDDEALAAARTTLDAMATGGIYDHLGGGFARYSTDRQWLVPHFEKMLYDNALLARLYLHAWQATGEPAYAQVVGETLDYLLRVPMRLPGSGFASAEDADSEGEEGRFYVWGLDEVLEVGGEEAAGWYGVTERGNWEGNNILRRPLGSALLRPGGVERSRAALFDRRETRVRPGLDDKVLTEWNAMAVAALAEAGTALDRPEWTQAGSEVGEFLLKELRREDGRWLRAWSPRGGAGHLLAYAADYAWLVEAFTRLGEATGEARWIGEATAAAEGLLEVFWDAEAGVFATVGTDAERLIAQPLDTVDGAVPSANSVAAAALLRLSALTGEARYETRARAVIRALAPALAKAPSGFANMVAAADMARRGLTEVTIAGSDPAMLAVVSRSYRPDVVLAWGEPYPSPMWDGRTGQGYEGAAFVCRDQTCGPPLRSAEDLATALSALPRQ